MNVYNFLLFLSFFSIILSNIIAIFILKKREEFLINEKVILFSISKFFLIFQIIFFYYSNVFLIYCFILEFLILILYYIILIIVFPSAFYEKLVITILHILLYSSLNLDSFISFFIILKNLT